MSAQQLASIVAQITRDTGRPARTKAIAARCYVAERTALYWLQEFEGSTIYRVGKKRGWVTMV